MRTLHRIKCLTGSRETKELTREADKVSQSTPSASQVRSRRRRKRKRKRRKNPAGQHPSRRGTPDQDHRYVQDLVTNISRNLSDLASSYEDFCTQTCNLSWLGGSRFLQLIVCWRRVQRPLFWKWGFHFGSKRNFQLNLNGPKTSFSFREGFTKKK